MSKAVKRLNSDELAQELERVAEAYIGALVNGDMGAAEVLFAECEVLEREALSRNSQVLRELFASL